MTKPRVCKDCSDETVPSKRRPAPHPGPRCATHHRARKRTVSARAHERRLVAQFGLTASEYAALYEAQGGVCYICRRATGATKRLAVEHDHELARFHDHPDDQACRKCVRGLACGWCNYDVLGRLGDDPATFERIASALRHPPARRLFTAVDNAVDETLESGADHGDHHLSTVELGGALPSLACG